MSVQTTVSVSSVYNASNAQRTRNDVEKQLALPIKEWTSKMGKKIKELA